MCGLAAIAAIGTTELGAEAESQLRRMSRAVAHRGPDGERITVQGPVGLAFRRLALVDPEDGDQPLHDKSGIVALIANGEVYNHRELMAGLPGVTPATGSDCEVLAHLYASCEREFLDNVNGMMAIVLHDRARNRLVLARDRFGIKPLYFARVGGAIIVASEIKALLAVPGCPRELDWAAALSDQSMHGAPVLACGPTTSWFKGVEMVPAGTIVLFDLRDGSRQDHVYWRLPAFDAGGSELPDREHIAAYRDVLAASVADCASADADVGLFLSGGIDSASVAALAAAQGKNVHTFTVCSASTVANGDCDAARTTARHLGLANDQLMFPGDLIPSPDYWKRLVWLLETPLCGPTQYFTYELHRHARSVRPGLKGMMLGQASDEFNGGYSPALSADGTWAGFEAAVSNLARLSAQQPAPALLNWSAHTGFSPFTEMLACAPDLTSGRAQDSYSRFIRWKYRDIQQYNCWHEDRTAAGNGIEARVPFLDHRLVELMASIPPPRRASLLWDKKILREAVADLLPGEITWRPKVAFYHDEGAEHTHRIFLRMLTQNDAALVDEALAGPGARQYLDAAVIRAWLAGLSASRAPSGTEFLLRLVNLGLLDQLARQSPPALAEQPPELTRASLSVRGDQDEAGSVLHRLCATRLPEPDEVVTMAHGFEVVRSVADDDLLYIAADGQFEYVIDASADPSWSAFVQHIRPDRTFAEVLKLTGVSREDVAGSLLDSLTCGVLQLAADRG